MKATGIVRKVDELGRIVIPKEIRKVLRINESDPVEIFTDGDKIVLKKYNPGCSYCGEVDGTVDVLNLKLCKNCIIKINKSIKILGLGGL